MMHPARILAAVTAIAISGGFCYTALGLPKIAASSKAFQHLEPGMKASAAAVDPSTGIIHSFAGGSADGAAAIRSTFSQPYDAALAPDGSIIVADTYNNRIRAIDWQTGRVRTIAGSGDCGSGGDGGAAMQASLNFPFSAA